MRDVRPTEFAVTNFVLEDELEHLLRDWIGGVFDQRAEHVEGNDLGAADQRGNQRLERGVSIEAHAPDTVRCHRTFVVLRDRFAHIAAKSVSHSSAGIGMTHFLLGPDGPEQAQVRLPTFFGEAKQQGGAFGDSAVFAPRAPRPVLAASEQDVVAVLRRVEVVPRNGCRRVPFGSLGPLIQGANRGDAIVEFEWKVLIRDVEHPE